MKEKYFVLSMSLLFFFGQVNAQDTDGDGIIDVIDIDDDNDGITDINEGCQFDTRGFVAGDNFTNIQKNGNTDVLTVNLNSTFSVITYGYYDIGFSNGGKISYKTTTIPLDFKISSNTVGNELWNGEVIKFTSPTGFTLVDPSNIFTVQNQTATELQLVTNSSSVSFDANDFDDWSITTNSTTELTITQVSGGNPYSGFKVDFGCIFDTDLDGITNNLDLDSDGDGCPDAFEAGLKSSFLVDGTLPDGNPAVSTTFTNGQVDVTGGVGINGLANNLENSDNLFIVTRPASFTDGIGYFYKTRSSIINDCNDLDSDGIPNWEDLDDDNDGVIDGDEGCEFDYTTLTADINNTVIVQKDKTNSNLTINFNSLVNTQSNSSLSFFNNGEISYATDGVQLNFVINANRGSGFWDAEVISFTTTDSPIDLIDPDGGLFQIISQTANSLTVKPTQHVNSNKNWRIETVSDDLTIKQLSGGNSLGGIRVNFGCIFDTDLDGITNNLDLDSDGDKCSDAVEAGLKTSFLADGTLPDGDPAISTTFTNGQVDVTGGVGINGLANTIENSDNAISAIVRSASYITGSSTYNTLAIDNTVSACGVCYITGDTSSVGIDSNSIGITTLNRLNKLSNSNTTWPQSVKNGQLILESSNKGFVLTRIASETNIINPVEGMIFYDTGNNCLKLYDGSTWGCIKQDCSY